jgi:ketosteroid isomerase-like protein
MKGNPESAKMMFSHEEDVTLANPYGPAARGYEQVVATMEGAASHYKEGEVVGVENVAKYATFDLAYIVEVERYRAKVAGRDDIAPFSLRATTILRREESIWKVVHRHADPIATPQPTDSVLGK